MTARARSEGSAEVPARLVLLRHAVAEAWGERCTGRGRVFDPGLAPEGLEQAATAARRLGRRLDLVVSSPARRALETAKAWDLPVRVDERLAERSFGEWEGRRWDELWPTVPPEVLADMERYVAYTPPGGEPLEAVAARAEAAMRDLAPEPGQVVLAVTHAGPLRLMVAAALGLPAPRALSFGADHGRAALLDRYDSHWVLQALNR